ncbi:PREDICTED: cell adhesion molecule-related/down-regulated by oncogenes [Nanorana parkeri]|uniref:cell adhesion molecule-related/down-regulated by oncogenes n=1 Tax=Nanorana parkeri TaxID=125878 RepID=UPI000854B9B5|nr:PREDICTED: cell adhesion molecule-related/down-regulated by oncogenes [Nanorana parkeri]
MHPGPWHPLLCFSLLLLCTRGDSDVTPRFLSEPLSTVQKPGVPVTLLCAAEPPWSHISWLFNGRLLDRTRDGDIQPGHLTILSLGLHHAGRYQCTINTSRGSLISTPANVSVAYLGDFESVSRVSVVAEEGSTAIITCGVPSSVPRAQIHYRVRGKWLDRSSLDKYLILPSGNLQIVNVTLEDRGPYRCAAYNPVTHERKISPSVYKLAVTGSSHPDFIPLQSVPTQRLSVHLHETLTLECVAGGVSARHVYWYKDGQSATDHRRTLLHTNLVIKTVERLDVGNYSCLLANETREVAHVTYSVIVLEAPLISRAPEDQTAPAGSDVMFTCEAQGNPAPNITWLHNTASIYPSPRLHPLANTLHVSNVAEEDAGMYQCMADNGVGVVQASARLHVHPGSGSRPVIVSPPTSVSVVIGDWVTLTCNATGNPAPSIRWYGAHGAISSHPSQILRPKPRKALQSRTADTPSQDPPHVIMSHPGSSSLYISAVTAKHAGKYVCKAANELGSTQEEATVTVVPNEISTVRADTSTPSLTRTTTHPSLPPTDKPLHGALLPEAPIILSPPQTTKPDVYFLVWRSGRDGGLPINAYFVRYRKLDDDGNVDGPWNSIRVPASENEFPLTELEPSSLYEVLMVARNAAGEGQPAMLTFRTSKERSSSSKNTPAMSPPAGAPKQTPMQDSFNSNFGLVNPDTFRHSGVPEAPDRPTISSASETSVYVTWIPRANGGSPITSFKVEYKRAGRLWVTAAENIPPSKLSVEVSNLEPGAMYKFRVIAINNYGESTRSSVSRPYQVAAYGSRLPNPLIVGPRIDHTEAVTDTHILLKWTYVPSNNNNTPIQGFYIYYRPTDSDNDGDYKRDVVEGTKHQHLIRDLQPETSYDIKMQCFNERGASDYSNVMICETKARRSPGASEFPPLELSTTSASERNAGGSSSSSITLARSGDMLYVIVGCVLGGMVLILMTFIAMCLLKHRQQRLMHKFEPPGYLYQGSDLNGQMVEYTTLPGTNRINGTVHGGFMGNGNIANGCPHMHHGIHNGINGVMNGELYPTCSNPHKGTCPDYEHLPHSIANGGILYTAIPQTDPSECINCRNCCNNNRCFSKSGNGVTRTPLQENPDTKQLMPEAVPMIPSSPECGIELQEEVNEKPSAPCTPSQDGLEEIQGDSDICVKEDDAILPPSPDTPSNDSENCDENKTWTLENSPNDLPQQPLTQEA